MVTKGACDCDPIPYRPRVASRTEKYSFSVVNVNESLSAILLCFLPERVRGSEGA